MRIGFAFMFSSPIVEWDCRVPRLGFRFLGFLGIFSMHAIRESGRSDSGALPARFLESVRAGGAGELGRLLEGYRNYLSILAQTQLDRKLRGRVGPSDIVQETMLEAHRDFAQFRGQSEPEFLSWLRKILANNLAEAIEVHILAGRRDVRRDVSLAEIRTSLEKSTVQLGAALAAADKTPSSQAQQHERSLKLADAMGLLPPDYRQVLLLRNLQELPFKEVAENMGRSVGAAKMLWLRAIKALQDVFLKAASDVLPKPSISPEN